jgi:DNA-binding transcriptional MerR regulator
MSTRISTRPTLKSHIDVRVKAMKIGELSERTGASVRMLRYYEEQGLLEPERTGSGYRVYAEPDVDRVARIRCMFSAAVPAPIVLTTLRFILDGRPVRPGLPAERERLVETLQAELDELDAKIASLRNSRALLARVVADVREATVGPENPGDPEPEEWSPTVLKSGPGLGARRRAG